MANKIQLKRGLKSRIATLSAGEPAYTTDTRELFIGTGSGNVNMGGSMWYTGTDMSGTSASTTYYYSSCPPVKLGDMYLNTGDGSVYQCTTAGSGTTAKWTYKGNIKGAKGDKGGADFDKECLINIFQTVLPNINIYGIGIDDEYDGYCDENVAAGKIYFINAADANYMNIGTNIGFLVSSGINSGTRLIIRIPETPYADIRYRDETTYEMDILWREKA